MAAPTETEHGKRPGADAAAANAGTSNGDPVQRGKLGDWFAELKRRRVFRALVAYGIASFAVLQIIEPIMHGAHWPEIVLSYVVAALAAGFPIIIALAWIFDVRGGRIERTTSRAGAKGPRGVQLALMLLGVGVLAAAPGLLYYFFLRGGARISTQDSNSVSSAKSIAVLPFASLSPGEDNAYLAQGFHDELLRQLGRISDLRVISRTSVLQYKDGTRNVREIADALAVSSVVEGSLQRVGTTVRVTAKLIDARIDRQLWADDYERELNSLFGIQTEVAEQIVRALNARLSPAQKAQIERRPTRSSEAYDLYLRASEYFRRPADLPKNMAIAERLLRQAIEIDSSFAVAHARLAYVILLQYWYVAGTPESVAEKAREEAERALQLEPDLPEAHLALGIYHHFAHRDYEKAVREYEIARAGVPNEAIDWLGFARRRQGKFDEAIRYQQEAYRLDPLSADTLNNLTMSLILTRRYQEAEPILDRALKMIPDSAVAAVEKALLLETWRGETHLAKAVIMDSKDWETRTPVGQQSLLIELLEHHPAETLLFLDSARWDSLATAWALYPKAFLSAAAHEALGDSVRAQKEFETARPVLETEAEKNPTRAHQRILLARAYAALGRKDDALREASRAVEVLPISRDAWFGSNNEIGQAMVEARVGEKAKAIKHIRSLLSIPCLLSPALLRVDPRWAPLRDDPSFRKLAQLDAG